MGHNYRFQASKIPFLGGENAVFSERNHHFCGLKTPFWREGKTNAGCSERCFHPFRWQLRPIPKSSLGGKVTLERVVDAVRMMVKNVWNTS